LCGDVGVGDRRLAEKNGPASYFRGGAKLSFMQQPARRAGEIEPTPFRHRMSLPPSIKKAPP